MQPVTRAWFATALLCLVGAAILHTALLFGVGSLWPALVHLTLFGWISAMIIAVNYHTMPVFSGRDFPQRNLIRAHLIVFIFGLVLAVFGLGLQPFAGELARFALVLGLSAELLAALLFALNIGLLLRSPQLRSPPPLPPRAHDQRAIDRVGTRATAAAGVSLPLALALLLGVRLDLLSGVWWLAAEHLAALGWVMLMIVGVADHVLPRFSGWGLRGAGWARGQLILHLIGLALIIGGLATSWSMLFALGGLTMAAALGLFAWNIQPTLHVVQAQPALIMPTVKERLP